MSEDPLWTFSLDLYGRPGAAPACLTLQDEAGADVTILLYLIWCAATNRSLDAGAVRAADDAVAAWRAAVVEPLRRVRRATKTPLLAGTGTEAFRDRIKAVEIEAERLALAALSAGAPRAGPPLDPLASARRHLDLYALHLGRPLPRAASDALLGAFAGL
ncbi:TIGR02444 family protein [Methylobacterium nodulans]|uniref:TIGR02444 family protein n=1 Tax=Methylobacterium nodulans (strain LMG 21967 / CNCM I-2342 / ORS 2060) TaxID=460265 RepID=B8IL37_METNO|nr:TIGR02444 family protein [Methylobacterium nodulans]ACL58225.1 conserved hypothetical protein [Methylobacterium nodulans ORS 2060]